MSDRQFLAIAGLMLLVLVGCQDDQAATNANQPGDAQATGTATEEVATLVWVQSDIQESDFELALGHRGDGFQGGDLIEPAVKIMMGDVEVKDAVVHSSLLADDGETILAEEQTSTFAAKTEEEPAHYATGRLKIPEDAKIFLIRFRIKLPEVETESMYDIERKISD